MEARVSWWGGCRGSRRKRKEGGSFPVHRLPGKQFITAPAGGGGGGGWVAGLVEADAAWLQSKRRQEAAAAGSGRGFHAPLTWKWL